MSTSRRSMPFTGWLVGAGLLCGCGSATNAPDRAPPPAGSDRITGCLTEGQRSTSSPIGREPGAAADSCCAGLTALDAHDATLMAAGRCILSKGGQFTCARCGDGHCGTGENWCNCVHDCGARP